MANIEMLPFRNSSRYNGGCCCCERHLRKNSKILDSNKILEPSIHLKEECGESGSNHNTRIVNEPGSQAIKRCRPLKIQLFAQFNFIVFLIFMCLSTNKKHRVFFSNIYGQCSSYFMFFLPNFQMYCDADQVYCVRSVAETVANRPIGDPAQDHIHHIFHHDVHL